MKNLSAREVAIQVWGLAVVRSLPSVAIALGLTTALLPSAARANVYVLGEPRLEENLSAGSHSGETDDETDGVTDGAIALDGTRWTLTTYNEQPVLAETEITATFSASDVTGSAGCNRYFSRYGLASEQITILGVGSTRQLCGSPAGMMDQERAYLELLTQVETVSQTGDTLTLSTPAGDLVFTAQVNTPDTPYTPDDGTALPFQETTWRLLTYGEAPVLDETNITAEFVDGRVTGSAGCNDYFGSVEQSDGLLSLSDIASTKVFCFEPEGIFEQEMAYLESLSQATGYAIEGNILTIATPLGDLVYEAQ